MQCRSPPPPRGKATLTGIRTRFQDFVKTCKCRTTLRNFSILTAISANRELDDSRKITQFFCPNLSENQFADFKPLVLVNRQHASRPTFHAGNTNHRNLVRRMVCSLLILFGALGLRRDRRSFSSRRRRGGIGRRAGLKIQLYTRERPAH